MVENAIKIRTTARLSVSFRNATDGLLKLLTVTHNLCSFELFDIDLPGLYIISTFLKMVEI